jgi:hypothetical protein
MTARERALMHLAQAETRADDPAAIDHLRAARRAVDEIPPTPLTECATCGQVGPRSRIRTPAHHDCTD